MAHHAEPMDVDDESDFDNKENTYQHTNVLPRTPCTEKGYEELDVSELNMKLRYSITPAASPMSKSMSHCLDNRYTSTDESLNNTVTNEYENNLTRSLNSTLNKTEVKTSKVLPLQALPADLTNSSRSTSVLQPLDSTVTANDITITVSNENEFDNLLFPSSSSSLANTPEATTPTKEIPKHDGGSPIMRGLKSVLSIFRSSQSPIPPGEEDTKTASVSNKADIPVPESKPQAIASTPKNENTKGTSLSRRNSPLKESVVFNEDLETELQWSDDSTIVFSSEKIPIRKLFFQDKSKRAISNEDPNSTVEYMDISYNDLSIRDKTLNGTVNKSDFHELPESDGEFVDCESTFTHSKVEFNTEESNELIAKNHQDAPEQELVQDIAMNNEQFMLDTTKDILNLIDSSQVVVGDLEKQIDFSTTDIVNRLSDLINEETVVSDDTLVKHIDNKDSQLSDVQLECKQEQVTSPVDFVSAGNISAEANAEQVCINNNDLVNTVSIDSDAHLESIDAKISSDPLDVNALKKIDDPPTEVNYENNDPPERQNDAVVVYPSPVDIPLPNDDLNDDLSEDLVFDDLQGNAMPIASISQNALMAALDKSTVETSRDSQSLQHECENKVNTFPPSLLSSDVPLHNTMNSIKTDNLPHETITGVNDPVQSSPDNKFDLNSTDMSTSKVVLLDETVNKSNNKAANIPNVEIEPEIPKTDISSTPSLLATNITLPTLNDLVKADDLPQETASSCPDSVQEMTTDKPDIVPFEINTSEVNLINKASIIKMVEILPNEVSEVVVNTPLTDIIIAANEENMEVSFVQPSNDKFSESLNMDVSMADATKADHIINPIEVGQNENMPHKFEQETAQCSSQAHEQISDGFQKEADNTTNEKSNKDTVLVPVPSVPITKTDDDLITNCISLAKLDENVNDVELILNNTSETVTTSELTTYEQSTPPKIEYLEEVAIVVKGKDNTMDVSKVNEVSEDLPDIVRDFDVTATKNMCTVKQFKNEKDQIVKKEDITTAPVVEELPSDLTINLNSSQNDHVSRHKEKVDEEIVVSEGNSPFVSMSADEAYDPDLKKEEFEEVGNVFSTKDREIPSPPASPKIVSKGYNLNFDDIDLDSMNPFATKTKIRMSPPPGASPNASLVTENLNKTEIVQPVKVNNNINRRKSMPERKKPLKAKRHFNSTFDSTENTSSKTVPKNDDLKVTLQTETNEVESNIVAPPTHTHNLNHEKFDVTVSSKTLAQEQGEEKQPEPVAIPSVDDSKETNVKSAEENDKTLNETKIVEDYVTSDGCKSDTASSSEQSTYFSAGVSSTELTESKNVFNLYELDDFNPFVTKSKIRQSPPRELDMDNPFATKSKIKTSPDSLIVVSQPDPNCTVTIDNETELKEATQNESTCSGSSRDSDEKDVTVHEVHTEDEDTLEGPFLEADGGNDGNKLPEFADSKADVVELANLIPQDNEDAAEMFIDAEAFEFLMNQNNSDEVAYSGKESLFLKFDPLFARRVTSEGVSAALNEIKKRQSTPKKAAKQTPPKDIDHLSFDIPVAGPSDLNNTCEVQSIVQDKSDDVNLTVSKPMMAVTPAVNPIVTPRKSLTPNKLNRLSMTFTSPAMAVIDRLLSLSSNSPSADLDATVTHVDRTHNEADQALTQLRELLAEKEIHVYNLRCESKELKDRLSTLETQMKTLEAESAERLKKVNELNENLAEKTKMNRNMASVVEEYERTIASLISETEQDKKRYAEERNQLISERDEQTAHLASMEVSFNDLHSKYEKSKQVILGYKTNEEAYKKSLQVFEENLSKMHSNYELLKQHAASKLNHANQELEKINKAHEAEVLKFNAMIKRKEMHITSLEESLAQKTKANEELTAICDELINKVG